MTALLVALSLLGSPSTGAASAEESTDKVAAPAPSPSEAAGRPSQAPDLGPLPSPLLPLPTAGPVPTQKYRIGPDDAIRVQVVGSPEFGSSAVVSPRGTIVLPILGEVEAAGSTSEELQARLARIIGSEYKRDPQVLVEIATYNNMKVWIFGFVSRPGEYRLTGPTTILELLSIVGDIKANASSTLTIERHEHRTGTNAEGKTVQSSLAETVVVDVDALLRQADVSQNLLLQNGDKIYVPGNTAKVYAFGEVGRPGFYPFREGMTLADLIQLAGGLTQEANLKKIKLKRTTLPKEITVNYKDYLKKGEIEGNVPLQEGDTILVNSSFFF